MLNFAFIILTIHGVNLVTVKAEAAGTVTRR